MARRGRGRRSGSGGGLFSSKNLIGTLGGAILASKVGFSPAIGAAAGSFLYGKKGIAGAALGYFVAPMALGMLNSTLGGVLGSSSSTDNGAW